VCFGQRSDSRPLGAFAFDVDASDAEGPTPERIGAPRPAAAQRQPSPPPQLGAPGARLALARGAGRALADDDTCSDDSGAGGGDGEDDGDDSAAFAELEAEDSVGGSGLCEEELRQQLRQRMRCLSSMAEISRWAARRCLPPACTRSACG
jgi:hypothetical protein